VITQRLESLDEKLDRLLVRSEQWLVQGATCTAEITAMKAAFEDWKGGRRYLWDEIHDMDKTLDGMRRLVFMGVGVAAACSFISPVIITLAVRLFA
jgi:hypothetical protein